MDMAFASIAFGDATSFCVSAVLGERLKQLDPRTPRLLVTETDEIGTKRELGELVRRVWRVVHTTSMSGVPPILALKLHLWSLPARRIVYFDADNFPLRPFSEISLQHLRNLNLSMRVAGSPQDGRGPDCFNSGFLVLEPSNVHFRSMQALVQEHPTRSGVPPRKELRCHNLDQMFLNFYFQARWYDIGRHWVVNSFYRCRGIANSFHLFRDTRPWEHVTCNGQNANSTPETFFDVPISINGRQCRSSFGSFGRRGRAIDACKTTIQAVSKLWWETAARSTRTSDECLAIFSKIRVKKRDLMNLS